MKASKSAQLLICGLVSYVSLTSFISPVLAQETSLPSFSSSSAEVATQTAQLTQTIVRNNEDVTRPEQEAQRQEYVELFNRRPSSTPTLLNFMEFAVQYAVGSGVPANTIILILLLPILATIVAFFRHIIGLPSVGLLIPIAFSITLLATSITAGITLLIAILLASTIARMILKKIRIMQLPKMALSMLLVSVFIFLTLIVGATFSILAVQQISIFPILLLILLSERIVALQLERSPREVVIITFVTISIGILGYFLLDSNLLRSFVLLYPEVILLLIPINILIGRYFGLRLTEFFRFSPLKYGSK